jgi:serine/threonine protein kinase
MLVLALALSTLLNFQYKEKAALQRELGAYQAIACSSLLPFSHFLHFYGPVLLPEAISGYTWSLPTSRSERLPFKPYRFGLAFQRLGGPLLFNVITQLDDQGLISLQEELETCVGRLHSESGITHGDIKGDNIIMNEKSMSKSINESTYKQNHWVLIDFGNCQFRPHTSQWEKACARDIADVRRLFLRARAEIVSLSFIVSIPTLG